MSSNNIITTINNNLIDSDKYNELVSIGKKLDHTYKLCKWITNRSETNIEIYKLPDKELYGINLGHISNFVFSEYGKPMYLNLIAVINNNNPITYPSLIDHLTSNLTLVSKTLTRTECKTIIQNAINDLSLYDGFNDQAYFSYNISNWRINEFKNYILVANSIINKIIE